MGTCSHAVRMFEIGGSMRLIVGDSEIRGAIERLAGGGARVTTRQLRAELKRSFGHFGNSVRVHRMLQMSRRQQEQRASPEFEFEESLARAAQNAAEWRKRAELAQHRERVHQDKWATEIYELRQALQEARKAIPSANSRSAEYLKLYADRERLAARVAELEGQLAQLSGVT